MTCRSRKNLNHCHFSSVQLNQCSCYLRDLRPRFARTLSSNILNLLPLLTAISLPRSSTSVASILFVVPRKNNAQVIGSVQSSWHRTEVTPRTRRVSRILTASTENGIHLSAIFAVSLAFKRPRFRPKQVVGEIIFISLPQRENDCSEGVQKRVYNIKSYRFIF